MGFRRKARECALQLLFQIDMTGEDAGKALAAYWRANPVQDPIRAYADRLVMGSVADGQRIDQLIEQAARNWKIERMSNVDRSLLRLATYELLRETDTSPRVVINEAIEIAKKFSSDEAAPFVNGVLDGVKRELEAEAVRDGAG